MTIEYPFIYWPKVLKRFLTLAILLLSFSSLAFILTNNRTSPLSTNVLAQTPDPSTVIDVVFIGENFTQNELSEYHTVVQNFIDALLTYEPFKSRANQFAFHIIDNTADLGCNGLFDCSPDYIDRAAQVIYDSGLPVDTSALIINSTASGGSATNVPLEMTVTGKSYPHIFVHEFGHSFGRLREEYVVNSGDGAITNTTLYNCFRGIPPAPEWEDLVGIEDYWPGCSYQNWYRPSPLSVMRSTSFHYFNGVSQNYLNQKITSIVGANGDSELPTVTIVSPIDNQTVSGTITVSSLISDNVGVTWGDLKVDGVLRKSVYLPPFDFSLNTGALSLGSHTISVRGKDAGQNIGEQTITINVVSPTPTPTPTPIPVTVSFTSASYSARENSKNAAIAVALSQSVPMEVRVNYQVVGGTATNGSDYNLSGGTLIFPAGTTSRSISMNLINDRVKEPDETIIVSSLSPQNATLGAVPSSTFTILNDDR